MSKKLKHLGAGHSTDPIDDVAAAIIATEAINGHKAGPAEIRELLEERGAEASAENAARVHQVVEEA